MRYRYLALKVELIDRIFGFKEKDEQYENELPKEEFVIAGESNKETGLATIKTIETIKSVSWP